MSKTRHEAEHTVVSHVLVWRCFAQFGLNLESLLRGAVETDNTVTSGCTFPSVCQDGEHGEPGDYTYCISRHNFFGRKQLRVL